jgi:hypothetical protein
LFLSRSFNTTQWYPTFIIQERWTTSGYGLSRRFYSRNFKTLFIDTIVDFSGKKCKENFHLEKNPVLHYFLISQKSFQIIKGMIRRCIGIKLVTDWNIIQFASREKFLSSMIKISLASWSAYYSFLWAKPTHNVLICHLILKR